MNNADLKILMLLLVDSIENLTFDYSRGLERLQSIETKILPEIIRRIGEHDAPFKFNDRQWISVEEPPHDGQRIVAVGLTSDGKEYTSVEMNYSDKVGFISNITGWMPLPDPSIK